MNMEFLQGLYPKSLAYNVTFCLVYLLEKTLMNFHFHAAEKSDIDRGEFGAGAHSDWGFMTLLITDDVPGLQVYPHVFRNF